MAAAELRTFGCGWPARRCGEFRLQPGFLWPLFYGYIRIGSLKSAVADDGLYLLIYIWLVRIE